MDEKEAKADEILAQARAQGGTPNEIARRVMDAAWEAYHRREDVLMQHLYTRARKLNEDAARSERAALYRAEAAR